MTRICKQGFDIGLLDLLAGIHHDHALRGLRDHAEVVRDQDQAHAELFLQVEHKRENLRLNRHVKRGGRLIGDQQRRAARQRHRDHRPLAHAAGQLMRIFLRAPLWLGNADQTQHFDRLIPGFSCRHGPVQANRLADLIANPDHRVERSHRLLKDHGNAVTADLSHLGFIEREQILAFEQDRAADDAARRARHKAHDRERTHALAASGLADDRQRLATTNVEREVVYRAEQPRTGEEHRLQALHIKHIGFWRNPAHQPRCLGSRMSRKASPNRLVPNTARLIAIPGKITSHGAVRTYSAADSESMRPQDG